MQQTSGERRIRVVVSANSSVSRAGLESIVRNSGLLELAGSFAGLLQLGPYLSGLHPDVLLVELNRDELELVGRAQGLTSLDCSIPTVALMGRAEDTWIARALRSGVKGILPRDASSAEIVWEIGRAS